MAPRSTSRCDRGAPSFKDVPLLRMTDVVARADERAVRVARASASRSCSSTAARTIRSPSSSPCASPPRTSSTATSPRAGAVHDPRTAREHRALHHRRGRRTAALSRRHLLARRAGARRRLVRAGDADGVSMIYRKRGSVVRWENGTLVRVAESGMAIEEGRALRMPSGMTSVTSRGR